MMDSVLNKSDTLWPLSCPHKILFRVQCTAQLLGYATSNSKIPNFWDVT